MAQALVSKRGPAPGKPSPQSNSDGAEDVRCEDNRSDSDSSFSPSQVHPSRLPPYLRNKLLRDQPSISLGNGLNSPIQLLSVESSANSSELPSLSAGAQGAVENTPIVGSSVQPVESSATTSEFVEATPFESSDRERVPPPTASLGQVQLPLASTPAPAHDVSTHSELIKMAARSNSPSPVRSDSDGRQKILPTILTSFSPMPSTNANAKLVLGGWSDLFKSPANQSFSLRFIPPEWVEGIPVVSPPAEVFKVGESKWHHTLVGKFVGKSPSLKSLKDFTAKVWGHIGPISVSTAGEGFALFKFSDEPSCLKVLKKPWHFNHKPFLLKQWRPGIAFSDLFTDSLELWVRFYGIPVDLVTGEGLSHIVSSIGTPLQVDTLAIEDGRLNCINVLLRIDPSKPRPSFVKVNLLNGSSTLVRVAYQDQPITCNLCKRTGHFSSRCRLANTADIPARGRSKSKGLSSRDKSVLSKNRANGKRTQAVWVEKNVSEKPVDRKSSEDPINIPNKEASKEGALDNAALPPQAFDHEEGGGDSLIKSDQEIDPVLWKEVRTRRKKKNNKKKKSGTPPSSPSHKKDSCGKGKKTASRDTIAEHEGHSKDQGQNVGIVILEKPNAASSPASSSPSSDLPRLEGPGETSGVAKVSLVTGLGAPVISQRGSKEPENSKTEAANKDNLVKDSTLKALHTNIVVEKSSSIEATSGRLGVPNPNHLS